MVQGESLLFVIWPSALQLVQIDNPRSVPTACVVDDSFGYWLAGLIDGEGCFIIAKGRSAYQAHFSLSLRADDERIIREIHSITGLGTVNLWNQMIRWQITNRADALALTTLLDAYPLRTRKRMDFATWKMALLEMVDHLRGDSWVTVVNLRERLMRDRKFAT